MTERPVVLRWFDTSLEATVVRDRLDEAGIPAQVVDGSMGDLYTGLVGPVRASVVVPADQVQEAERILQDDEEARTAAEGTTVGSDEAEAEEAEPDEDADPHAGDRWASKLLGIAILGWLTFPIPIVALAVLWRLLSRPPAPLTRGGRVRATIAALLSLTALVGASLLYANVLRR